MLYRFPGRKCTGRSVNMGLNLCARPPLKIAVVCGVPILLKIDKGLGNGLQLTAYRRIARTKLPADCLL